MLAIILALFSSDAHACSPMPASALWSFPSDLASDVAINQPLHFRINSGDFGDVSFNIWNTTTEVPIEGSISYACSDEPNGWDHCLATFIPDGGFWGANAQVSWSATPSEDVMGALSGSFSTSDEVRASELPESVAVQAEMLEWRPVENECDTFETIRIDMSLESDFWQQGSIIQVLQQGVSEDQNHDSSDRESDSSEGDSTIPEELSEPHVIHQVLVREGTEMQFEFDILASEEEHCFSIRVQSADTRDFQQYDGPCLQWNGHVPGSGISCATSAQSRGQSLAWATLFLALSLRRRRAS